MTTTVPTFWSALICGGSAAVTASSSSGGSSGACSLLFRRSCSSAASAFASSCCLTFSSCSQHQASWQREARLLVHIVPVHGTCAFGPVSPPSRQREMSTRRMISKSACLAHSFLSQHMALPSVLLKLRPLAAYACISAPYYLLGYLYLTCW